MAVRSSTREVLVVVGVAVAGVVLAAIMALVPWTDGDGGAYPHVARVETPVATAPRG
jgi:orotate phosphoribosyltransferase